MKLQDLTWTQVEEYLKHNKSIIIPVGSCEQHGPTGLIGTDFQAAEAVATQWGEKTKTLVAPSINFGMAEHHMAFPGTISLHPETFIQVICDVVRSLDCHGFENLIFVNGHGGNIAPITTAFCQVKSEENQQKLFLENWWHLEPVRKYEEEHFGDENGFHATVGEVSLTMHIRKEAFQNIQSKNFEIGDYKKTHWPQSAFEFRENFPDGRMGSNPGLATADHGSKLLDLAVNYLQEKYNGLIHGL